VVRIDHVVAELELDVLDLDLEVIQQGLVDDVADGSVLLV